MQLAIIEVVYVTQRYKIIRENMEELYKKWKKKLFSVYNIRVCPMVVVSNDEFLASDSCITSERFLSNRRVIRESLPNDS